MEDWPWRFIAACKEVGISKSDILHGADVPFAFWHPVFTYLSEPVWGLNDDELAAAQDYLLRQGTAPNRQALAAVTGAKIRPRPGLGQPVDGLSPYGTGRYWKIDGVSPQVKDAVKVAARRAGMGVGLWLEETLRKQLNLLD